MVKNKKHSKKKIKRNKSKKPKEVCMAIKKTNKTKPSTMNRKFGDKNAKMQKEILSYHCLK